MMFYVAPDVHYPEDYLGLIPSMIRDNRPLREQLNEGYAHGGGWKPFRGFTLKSNGVLTYPGDPDLPPKVWTIVNGETLIIYDHAWVCIEQADHSFEVCRMD